MCQGGAPPPAAVHGEWYNLGSPPHEPRGADGTFAIAENAVALPVQERRHHGQVPFGPCNHLDDRRHSAGAYALDKDCRLSHLNSMTALWYAVKTIFVFVFR